jgi:hypothetical protein
MYTPNFSPSYPVLSWSESRARHYRECKRRYYLRTYRQHNGWRPGAPADSRLAWALGRLTSIPIEVGAAIHAAAALCVRACTNGQSTPDAKWIHEFCARRLNATVRRSRRGAAAFLRDAARTSPVLDQYFYGDVGLRAADVKRVREQLDILAVNLAGAVTVWDELRRAAAGDVVLVAPFYNFHIESDAALIYAAPDLLYRSTCDATWTILDWKSGAHDAAVDQLCTYAVALADGLQLPPVGGEYRGRVVALGDGGDYWVAITSADLHDARQRIRDDLRRMRSHLLDVEHNVPADLDAFPQTSNERLCVRCAYRGLCFPELLPSAAAALLHAQPREPTSTSRYDEVPT